MDEPENEVEDMGLLDEKALANLKAQEEDNSGVICFEEIDFHPDEPRPPNQFMYSAYFEHIRHTLNTYLRRPIKKQFITNSKKCVLTVVRNQNRTIDDCYTIKQYTTFHDKAETLLDDASRRMFLREEQSEFTSPLMREMIPLKRGVKGVIKQNRRELDKHSLVPYYRTREFRRKIAKIYYPVIIQHSL